MIPKVHCLLLPFSLCWEGVSFGIVLMMADYGSPVAHSDLRHGESWFRDFRDLSGVFFHLPFIAGFLARSSDVLGDVYLCLQDLVALSLGVVVWCFQAVSHGSCLKSLAWILLAAVSPLNLFTTSVLSGDFAWFFLAQGSYRAVITSVNMLVSLSFYSQ